MPLVSIPTLASLASWRTLAILLAVVNIKALPLAWHVRLFFRMFTHWYTSAEVKRTLKAHADNNDKHPLFAPVSILSRSPLLETDYNLHKSNSTYFADLDESRTALMTKVLVPSLKQGSKNLEREGHRGRLGVILGSVHTSFHREIKPYELYEVRSRILGWDKKWIVIASWFVRPAANGKEEILLASALSKYVVKKGKFTVSPERCFITAGWLPPKPANTNSGAGETRESSDDSESALQLPNAPTSLPSSEPSLIPTPDGHLPAPVAEQAIEATTTIVERLESVAENVSTQLQTEPLRPLTTLDKAGGEWDWHRIEMERIRGLRIAANWLALDQTLMEEIKY